VGRRLVLLGIVLALGGSAAAAAPASGDARVRFARHGDTLVLTGTSYRLTLNARNGRIVELTDLVHHAAVAYEQNRCLWGALNASDRSYIGGCSFAPRARRSFSAVWHASSSTLVLAYRGATFGSVTVSVRARPAYVDLQLTLRNTGGVRTRIRFPDALAATAAQARAGYAPNVLPGVRLGPGFFAAPRNDVQIYPSRWAFADYLAIDEGAGNLALYTVSPKAPQPAQVGFLRLASGTSCSGAAVCLFHEFETWVRRGTTWQSPPVRLRVGLTAQASTLAYRADNGIAAYPSLAAKLGSRLQQLASAPLLKANEQYLKPFAQWSGDLQKLPAPLLLHPVAFTPGGHDVRDPDFLPPDPRFGTTADLAAMVAAAHARGDLVMPYLNLSWWDPASPTMQSVKEDDVAVLDEHGAPVSIDYGTHTGVIVSPYAPFVRARGAQELARWQSDVGSDCVFLDQVGARPWLRDFNASSPDPESYDTGWLAFLAQHRSSCVMVEDGWDQLARDSVGFYGSLLMMSRELDLANSFYGAGNWQPYPLADWLFHDKVLLYQHDLFDGTLTADPEVLLWNAAFGFVDSYSWTGAGTLGDPRLELVSRLQRALGPHYAGVPLTTYNTVAPNVTESVFGDLDVLADWSATDGYETGGYGLAPQGFLARTADGSVLAGAFSGRFDGAALTPGTHYLIVERSGGATTVRQPVGGDTDVAVTAAGTSVTALAPDGSPLGPVPASAAGGRITFHFAASLDGRAVGAYRIS
jgi:hypothetical protein